MRRALAIFACLAVVCLAYYLGEYRPHPSSLRLAGGWKVCPRAFSLSVRSEGLHPVERTMPWARDVAIWHGGGREALLWLVTPPFGAARLILETPEGERLLEKNMQDYHPWKIACGELRGDGADQVAVGVRVKSRLHPVRVKRVFLYTPDPDTGKWHKYFEASRCVGALIDFAFVRSGRRCDLVTLERGRYASAPSSLSGTYAVYGDTRYIRHYRTEAFGFSLVEETPVKGLRLTLPNPSSEVVWE